MTPSFIILSAILVSSALAVVLLRNPLASALALILNLLGVACVFAILDAHFLAIVQVIVYAGAIMVLVLFVLMLLNVKAEERGVGSWFQLIMASAVGLAFIFVLGKASYEQWGTQALASPAGEALEGTVQLVGSVLFTKYLLPFEAASILIMSAIVGAVMLAKAEKPKAHNDSGGE